MQGGVYAHRDSDRAWCRIAPAAALKGPQVPPARPDPKATKASPVRQAQRARSAQQVQQVLKALPAFRELRAPKAIQVTLSGRGRLSRPHRHLLPDKTHHEARAAVVLEPDQSASREMLLIEIACRVPQANDCTM